MAKDEDSKLDLTDDFGKSLQKDLKITKSQMPDVSFVGEDKDLWQRVRKNMRDIRKQRRRKR